MFWCLPPGAGVIFYGLCFSKHSIPRVFLWKLSKELPLLFRGPQSLKCSQRELLQWVLPFGEIKDFQGMELLCNFSLVIKYIVWWVSIYWAVCLFFPTCRPKAETKLPIINYGQVVRSNYKFVCFLWPLQRENFESPLQTREHESPVVSGRWNFCFWASHTFYGYFLEPFFIVL